MFYWSLQALLLSKSPLSFVCVCVCVFMCVFFYVCVCFGRIADIAT